MKFNKAWIWRLESVISIRKGRQPIRKVVVLIWWEQVVLRNAKKKSPDKSDRNMQRTINHQKFQCKPAGNWADYFWVLFLVKDLFWGIIFDCSQIPSGLVLFARIFGSDIGSQGRLISRISMGVVLRERIAMVTLVNWSVASFTSQGTIATSLLLSSFTV